MILFVDPIGTKYTDGYRKIDEYSRIFETDEQKKIRDFSYKDFTINTKLLLKPKRGIANILGNYRKYWFDNFADFARSQSDKERAENLLFAFFLVIRIYIIRPI